MWVCVGHCMRPRQVGGEIRLARNPTSRAVELPSSACISWFDNRDRSSIASLRSSSSIRVWGRSRSPSA